MVYYDFSPEPIMAHNTNGVHMFYDMLNTHNQDFLTQSAISIARGMCCCGNGYFEAVRQSALNNENYKEQLMAQENVLSMICSDVAQMVKREFDSPYVQDVVQETTKKIEVEKTRKVGLFKTEKYIDYEDVVEKELVSERFGYKGWLIERLTRKEEYPDTKGLEILYMDYYLGADGKLYCVVFDSDGSYRTVLNCICYSPLAMDNTFCMIFAAAMSGAIGVLDAVEIDPNSPSRQVNITLDSNYYYNFPFQIDNFDAYPYPHLAGVIKRIFSLISEDEATFIASKYGLKI